MAQPGTVLRTAVVRPRVTPRAVTKERGVRGRGAESGPPRRAGKGRGLGPSRPRLRAWCGVGGSGAEPGRRGTVGLGLAPAHSCCADVLRDVAWCCGSAGGQSCQRPVGAISARRCIRCPRALS